MLQEPSSPDPPKHRVRGALRALSTVLIVSGAMLMLDAGLTLVWQEPISALYAQYQQDALQSQLNAAVPLSDLQLRALDRLRTERRRIPFLARLRRREIKAGDPFGRIRIQRTATNFVVVEGTDPGDLRKGPGHYSDTTLPGLPGTVAIAGHRTTYLAPFRDLYDLRAGDTVVLEMPYGRFTYRFESKHIVSPKAYKFVTGSRGYERLALTACHPLYSAAQRIVVFARLVRSEARGKAKIAPSI
jgi:sortase A